MGSDRVTVYGSSDDLLCVGGDLMVEQGIYGDADDGVHLALSCGVCLYVQYTGDWIVRFDQKIPDGVDGNIHHAHEHEHLNAPDYSDVAVVTAESIDWAVLGHEASE